MLIGGLGANGTNIANAQSAEAQLIAQLQLQIQALQAQIGQLLAAQGQTNVTLAALARIMTPGTSGDDVKVLQAILAADATIYVDAFITGFYGPLTTRAVSRFQAQQGLAVTGTVDAATLARLQAMLNDMRIALEVDAGTGTRRPCAAVPPGHLIAPGWLRIQAGSIRPIVPVCQVLPPGISAQIQGMAGISAVTATNITGTSATINFMTNVSATGKVWYSTTSPVNPSTSLSAMGNANATVHAITLTNLSANTRYYFVIEARDSAGGVTTSTTFTFTTSSTVDINVPTISGVAAVNVSANGATINFMTNESATGRVFLSTTSPVNTSTATTITGSAGLTSHSLNLVNLQANTTYYYVVEAWDASGNRTVTAQGSFTTSASGSADTSAPVISSINVSAVGSTSATVNWSTNENATGRVYYSTASPVNTSTSASVAANASVSSQSTTLTGLQANTTYYFVVESRDSAGNVSTSGNFTFTTSASGSADTSAPVMSAIAIAVTGNSATISWTTNEAATGKVYYSTTSPVNMSTSASVTGSANVTAHVINLVGLSANTTYYVVLESRDNSNNVSTSAQYQFTTLVQ